MNLRSTTRVVGAVLAAATVAIVICIFPHRYFEDPFLIVSSLALAISVASVTNSPRLDETAKSDAGWIGSLGVQFFFAFSGLILSLTSVVLAGLSVNGIASALVILAFVSQFFSVFASRTTRDAVQQISDARNFGSAHLKWGDELASLANDVPDASSKDHLLKLAERTRYLARDVSPGGAPIDGQIDGAIQALSQGAGAASVGQMEEQMANIDKLFTQREIQIKASRRKS